MYRKKGLPKVGELVVCTITRADQSSAFVNLDEFDNKEAMIHVSEMPRRWVRNMKTYLKKGRKLVCKVMDANSKNNHVNLSIRRVSDNQSRNKIANWNDEKKANEILEVFAKRNKLDIKKLYTEVWDKILEKYDSIYPFFQEVAVSGEKIILDVGVNKKLAKQITELIQKRIQIPKYIIEKDLILTSTSSNGLKVIQDAIALAEKLAKKEKVELNIRYVGAPIYKLKIITEDGKLAEEILEKLKDKLDDFMRKNEGTVDIKKPIAKSKTKN